MSEVSEPRERASSALMPSGLTAAEEIFCQNIVRGNNQSDAYRAAYDTSRYKDSTIHRSAKELMTKPKLIARIAELRAPVIKKVQITLEEHINKLGQLSDLAAAKDQYSAAINGEMLRGKVSGLYVDKIESKNINLNGSLASEIKLSRLTDDELAEYLRLTAKASDESLDGLKVVTDV
jgi:hypothetical protein